MQKFYLVGETDHFKATNMKELFVKMKVKPDIIFSEGTGKAPTFRTYSPFHEYLKERESMGLPIYEHILHVIDSNKNYNTMRKLEGNLFCVEDLNFMSFEVCLLDCVYLYSKRKFNALKTLSKNGLEELNYEFLTLEGINQKIIQNNDYDYNKFELKLAEITEKIIEGVIKEYTNICWSKNYDAFKTVSLNVFKMYSENELKIYRDLRNEIFYENIKKNLRDEENVVIFLGDAHMPYFQEKFPSNTYVRV